MQNAAQNPDVIIVGAGLAGIVTALELLNLGKKVLLLEADHEKNLGGLAKESFGGIFFVGSDEQKRFGIKDTPELALSDWLSFAEFGQEDVLPKQWAEQYVNECTPYVYRWLKKHGIKFFPVVHWVERGLLKPGNSLPRFHMVWGTGHGLIVTLSKHLREHNQKNNLDLRFRHRITELTGGPKWRDRGEGKARRYRRTL